MSDLHSQCNAIQLEKRGRSNSLLVDLRREKLVDRPGQWARKDGERSVTEREKRDGQ